MNQRPIDALFQLVQVTRNNISSNRNLADELKSFMDFRLTPLLRQWEVAEKTPYVLALVGLTNVGKSTLLKTLFGFDVAPTGMGPATAIPVRYVFGERWQMEVTSNSYSRQEISFDDAAGILAELKMRVVGGGPAATSATKWVDVEGPIPILKDGLVIADTPGFGAAQAGVDEGTHQRRLEEFLQRIHRIYFCVSGGDQLTISDVEAKMFQSVAHVCGEVVVNKWAGDDQEKKEYQKRYQHLFPNTKFLFVNAKRAANGKQDEIRSLSDSIDESSTLANRVKACALNTREAWRDINDFAEKKYDTQVPWNKFCLGRLESFPEFSSFGVGTRMKK